MPGMGPQHARSTPLLIVGVTITVVIATTIVAAAGGTWHVWSDGDSDLFDEIYRRSQPIDATLKTVHATFTETTTSPLLATPLEAEGTLTAVRPSDVELTYTKPERKTITIKGNQLRFAWPDRNLHQERDITEAQARIHRYFVAKKPDELRRHFKIAASEDRTRAGTYLIDMIPKRKQIQQGLARLELWVRQDTLMLDAMRMTFPGGQVKMMEFRQVEVNGRRVGG
jgi:outer membrane lipoprotein-sorting protein